VVHNGPTEITKFIRRDRAIETDHAIEEMSREDKT
jgi:hypothetical protein